MNLIEQLGGYEKAKVVLAEYIVNTLTPSQIGAKYGVWPFTIQILTDALLQYRREHGIYEVGDPLVSRCNNEFRLFTYEAISGKNIAVKCKKGKAYFYPKKWFQHATDEEIKAGNRLEVGNAQ